MRLRLALVGLLAQQCAAGAAPAADASKDFPAGWCDTNHGTPTRTTGECMCKTACEGSGCRREQGFIWYSYASCPSCKCVAVCVEINQCVGFFTKSSRCDDAAVLAPSSGEEPASPRHRAGVASWRGGRRDKERAVKF